MKAPKKYDKNHEYTYLDLSIVAAKDGRFVINSEIRQTGMGSFHPDAALAALDIDELGTIVRGEVEQYLAALAQQKAVLEPQHEKS